VLINRVLEAMRSRGIVHRELRRRARDRTRAPLIVVPSVFGSRLVDPRGRAIWGGTSRLFVGTSFAEAPDARADGVVDGFTLVPGVYRHDVFGGLLRYLAAVYGARPGEDLFVLSYDWRESIGRAAGALAALVAQVRGAGDDPVDLVGISSGGNVVRAFLAGAWSDDPDAALADPVLGAGVAAVRRVVYLGTPHRGSISAIDYTQGGIGFFTGSKHFPALPLHTGVTSIFDMMPAPGDRIFVDGDGASLALDHLDPATWRDLRLVGHDRPGLAADLARSRRLHDAVAAAADRHPPAIAIAGRHKPTAIRAVVDGRKVAFPCPLCGDDRSRYPFAFGRGDGVVPEATLAAAPGLGADGPWWVEPSVHHRIATDTFIHPLVVEALLAPVKPVPRERYAWPRNPQTRGVPPPEDDEVRA
jgi:hypothetical protein